MKKRNLLFAVIAAAVVALSACGSDVKLDSDGKIIPESAEKIAQKEVNRYCKDKGLEQYQVYKCNTGKYEPEIASNDDDLIYSFNLEGCVQYDANGDEDVAGDIVVFVAYDGSEIKIVKEPDDAPLNSGKQENHEKQTIIASDFEGYWRVRQSGRVIVIYGSADNSTFKWEEYENASISGDPVKTGYYAVEDGKMILYDENNERYTTLVYVDGEQLTEGGMNTLIPYNPE